METWRDKKITVVGVSHRPEKYGYRIFRDLLGAGLAVTGVNPRGIEVLGHAMFRTLKAVTPAPDLVITVVPPEVTERVVEECRELGVREIWMQPGSESDEAIAKAKQYGIAVTSHACIMVKKGVW